jgi:hypothetical protein
MSNIVTFPKTPASKARVQNMADEAIAFLDKSTAAQTAAAEKAAQMTKAAEDCRRAMRVLHYQAITHGESAFAVRLMEAELKRIKGTL